MTINHGGCRSGHIYTLMGGDSFLPGETCVRKGHCQGPGYAEQLTLAHQKRGGHNQQGAQVSRAGACESHRSPAASGCSTWLLTSPSFPPLLPKTIPHQLLAPGSLTVLLSWAESCWDCLLVFVSRTLWPSQELLKLNSGRRGEQESKEGGQIHGGSV